MIHFMLLISRQGKVRYSTYSQKERTKDDNEAEVLEITHHYVEVLDRYIGSVYVLDLIFNFHKVYFILDEIFLAGVLQKSGKKTVSRLITGQTAKEEASSISNMIVQATN